MRKRRKRALCLAGITGSANSREVTIATQTPVLPALPWPHVTETTAERPRVSLTEGAGPPRTTPGRVGGAWPGAWQRALPYLVLGVYRKGRREGKAEREVEGSWD